MVETLSGYNRATISTPGARHANHHRGGKAKISLKFVFLIALGASSAFASATQPAIETALHSLYDFDFPAAHAGLNAYIATHPSEPLPYAFRGAAYLFGELDRLGALESEFLTDDDRLVEKTRPAPDPVVRQKFLQAMDDTQKRAEAVLKGQPNDRDALFAMCVVGAVSSDYMALVEKRQIASLSPAKKANTYAQRLLKLDPKFYDAYLTTGFSEYMVGSLPFFIRWFVHFDNVAGDKQRGVRSLQMVAREGRYLGPLAKVFLGIIALREKRPEEARKLLAELVHDYPRNPLYRKELEKLEKKAASALPAVGYDRDLCTSLMRIAIGTCSTGAADEVASFSRPFPSDSGIISAASTPWKTAAPCCAAPSTWASHTSISPTITARRTAPPRPISGSSSNRIGFLTATS
jgi:hypothetical protein